MQGRVVAVAGPGQARDMAVGHPKDPAGRVPQGRGAQGCAVVLGGEDLPSPMGHKMYVPTAAAV